MPKSMKPQLTPVKYCRVCKSTKVLDLGIRRQYYLANLVETVSLSYAICKDCQFIFQGEYVGDEFLNFYYHRSSMLRRKDPTAYEHKQNERQSDFLARHVNLGSKRVLEIGAHSGTFLKHLQRRFGCFSYFEELSEEARRVLASQVELRDFRSLGRDKLVDLVVLRHVLEHIFDLDAFLEYLNSILAPEGCLFIEVPDWTHFDQYLDPLIFEHLNQFNSAGLVHFLHRMGWQVEALEKSIHPHDPATPNRVLRVIARRTDLPRPGNPEVVEIFRRFSAIHHDGWKAKLNSLLADFEGKSIALYPASHLTFEAIIESKLGDANVLGMFDIDAKKHGSEILGLTVFPPEDLTLKKPDLILLFTMGYEQEIRESFFSLGVTCPVVSISELISLARAQSIDIAER